LAPGPTLESTDRAGRQAMAQCSRSCSTKDIETGRSIGTRIVADIFGARGKVGWVFYRVNV
jgi:hypothetical protein